MTIRNKMLSTFLLISGAIGFAQQVCADTYPSRSIKIIVPYAPGGGADSFARLASPDLEKILEFTNTIVKENYRNCMENLSLEKLEW